jgi:hypothetical protein
MIPIQHCSLIIKTSALLKCNGGLLVLLGSAELHVRMGNSLTKRNINYPSEIILTDFSGRKTQKQFFCGS